MKNKIIYITILFSFLLPQARKVIAVADIESTGINEIQQSMFFNQFESELVQTQYYTVTSRSEVDKILKEQEFQSKGCTDQQCAAEIGKLLNADLMLLAEIVYDEESSFISVSLKLVDVLTAKIITAKTFTINVSKPYDIFPYIPEYLIELIESQDIDFQPFRKQSQGADTYGYLSINTIPKGITVKIDGDKLRNVTPIEKYKLNTGKHTIVVYSDNYERSSQVIKIIQDSTRSINITMAKKHGMIILYSKIPETNIYIGNNFIGKTPKKSKNPFEYELEVGKYDIRLEKKYYKTKFENIKVTGKPMELRLELQPEPVNISIITNPNSVDAIISIDGIKMGKKDYDGSFDTKLDPGTYSICGESEKLGIEKTIIIEPGKYQEIELKIKKGGGCKEIQTEKNNLIGLGVSLGLPSYLLNYNLRFSTKKLNFEYAADMHKIYANRLQGIEDVQILGNQFTLGIGSHQNGYWNIFYGSTTFSGPKTFTVLYVIDNTTYEYWGLSRKQYGKVFYYEIGLNWGDREFYNGKGQVFIQWGTMLKYHF